MAFLNSLLLLIIAISYVPTANSKSKFPLIKTKQNIRNIRFISRDNNYSLFQNRSGELILSLNFAIFPLIKGIKGSDYNVTSTPYRKFIVIEKNDHKHNYLSSRNLHEIFITKWMKKNDPIYIGQGISPQLHLDDSIISYYNPFISTIFFKDLNNLVLEYQVKISAKSNPYFIPTIVMIDNNSIVYTDINGSGYYGLRKLNRGTRETTLLWKAKSQQTFIEICKNKKNIFLFIKSSNPIQTGSKLIALPLNFKNINDATTIYNSNFKDYGNLKCSSDEQLFFVKNIKNKKSDVASIDLATKKIKIITDFGNVTQIVDMDGTILLPLNGEVYAINGRTDFQKDVLK